MRELTTLEVGNVSGASFFGSLGNAFMQIADVANGFLNAVAPLGLELNKIPGLSVIHHLGDAIIGGALDTLVSVGRGYGGTYTPVNRPHLESEWGSTQV